MLLLCYGLTRSGSTLAFELVRGILANAGHTQERLPDGPVTSGHSINYVEAVTRKKLEELLAAAGDRWIAVKTHSGMADSLFMYVERLQKEKRLQLIASYRDPRDICLSLVDAGKAARASNLHAFSENTDLNVAAGRVATQIENFLKWASVPGALLLPYDAVAFHPDDAIERIAGVFGLRPDKETVKRYAFHQAFTQKSRARPNRYLDELSLEQNREFHERFETFISNFIEGDPRELLLQMRQEILRRRALKERSGRADKP